MITDIMLKITNQCNLDCNYCYIEHKSNQSIEKHTIDNIVKFINYYQSINYNQLINVFVAGGEVTLVPINKLEYLYSNLYHPNFVNLSMNTNSYSFTDTHLDLLKKYNISISLSLDGNKTTHDLRRSDSFDKTIQLIQKLKYNNMRWGCVTVIDDYSTDHIEEIYDFFKDNHINTKMNPAIGYINPDKWAEAMIYVYERLIKEKFPFYEDTLSDLMYTKNNKQPHTNACNWGNCFQNYLSINYDGDITPCERLFGLIHNEKHQNLIINNINKDSFADIIYNPLRIELIKKIHERKEQCLQCQYYKYCGSGCSHDSLLNYGKIEHKDSFCNAKKSIINKIIGAS